MVFVLQGVVAGRLFSSQFVFKAEELDVDLRDLEREIKQKDGDAWRGRGWSQKNCGGACSGRGGAGG